MDVYLYDLDTLFSSLDRRSLILSGEKVFLGFLSVTLLGQYVNGLKVLTSEEKLVAINTLIFLKTVGDLEIYLRLTG